MTETRFGDAAKQWISDTVASAKSLIPAYITAKSQNAIDFCWLVEVISRNGNQRLTITLSVRRRHELFLLWDLRNLAPFYQYLPNTCVSGGGMLPVVLAQRTQR